MPDLGGTLDILSTFRPADHLLLDLYDEPEEVKRLTWEIHELWFRFYNEINEVLQPVNPGYCDWSEVYSDKPGYVLQSDFCYMIGPDMFEEFVLTELANSCKKLDRSIYHLDGEGQLNHLDMLLDIHELDVVQWVPGSNGKHYTEYGDVWRKIHASGKNMQIVEGGLSGLDCVMEQVGTGKGIHIFHQTKDISQKDVILDRLKGYGF